MARLQYWRLPLRSGTGVCLLIPKHPRAPIAGSRIQKRICLTLFSCQTGLSARKSVLICNALFQNGNQESVPNRDKLRLLQMPVS